jgi:hypothetical protein
LFDDFHCDWAWASDCWVQAEYHYTDGR